MLRQFLGVSGMGRPVHLHILVNTDDTWGHVQGGGEPVAEEEPQAASIHPRITQPPLDRSAPGHSTRGAAMSEYANGTTAPD